MYKGLKIFMMMNGPFNELSEKEASKLHDCNMNLVAAYERTLWICKLFVLQFFHLQ